MTPGERLVRSLPLKSLFYDGHERRNYMRMVAIAQRIIDDPATLERGRVFLDRFIRNDPRQNRVLRLWTAVLDLAPHEIVVRLLEDSDRGAELRASAPAFTTFDPAEAKAVWAAGQ